MIDPLTLAAGAVAPWVLNKSLDEFSGRFHNFVTTKITNHQKIFKDVLDETCEKYGLSSEEVLIKIQAQDQDLGTIKRQLAEVLEQELPEKHKDFLNDFLLKLLKKLSKQDSEGLRDSLLVEVDLEFKELKTKVARREDLQVITDIKELIDSIKKSKKIEITYLPDTPKVVHEFVDR